MSKSFIPEADAEYDIFFKNICQYANQKTTGEPPEWAHIPKAEVTLLTDNYLVWRSGYAPTLKPHTPAETAAKTLAHKASRKVLGRFIQVWIRGFPDAVTVEDLRNMGIPPIDPHPTPVPVPEDIPEVEAQTPKPRTLHFRFRRANMKRWGKPEDVHGMELVWLIADAPPVHIGELVHSSFATKSPLELAFDEDRRGKRFYYAARWETGTVKKGSFSEIFSCIIP